MKLTALFLLFATIIAFSQEIPSKEHQIAAAVLAAPPEFREGATVLGYDSEGKFVTLRTGTNSMICIADNPFSEGFNAAAYHKDLEPFMARGRELKAEGKSFQERFEIRGEEAKSGKLKMPENGSTLHILYGKEGKFDPDSGKVVNAIYRYVVYVPWATTESTGLPSAPTVNGGPWIMDPGTHRAHIMISPPAETQK